MAFVTLVNPCPTGKPMQHEDHYHIIPIAHLT